jgi:hypothetical protein
MFESASSLSFPALLPLVAKMDTAWCYVLLSVLPNKTLDRVLFILHTIFENTSHVSRVTQWLNMCSFYVHIMRGYEVRLAPNTFKHTI